MIEIESAYASAVDTKNAHKIVSSSDLKAIPRECLFTKGVFDILHAGHLGLFSYIHSIKGTRKVVVGIQSDRITAQRKGPGRPINNEELRTRQICNLPVVDYVFVHDEHDYSAVIDTLKPGVYVKGVDTAGPESSDVEATLGQNPELRYMGDGGRFIRYCDDGALSTSDMIRTILERYQEGECI